MKVAICTIFNGNYNYGGQLQAYALSKTIKSIGIKAEVIRYNGHDNIVYPTTLSRLKQYSIPEIICKFKERKLAKKSYLISNMLKNRFEAYNRFASENIPSSNKIYDSDCNGMADVYDAFVVGSDQVWNPNVINNLYSLNFDLKPNTLKIAYAASISRSKLSLSEQKRMLPLLTKFNSISVREKTAANYLSRMLPDNKITVTLDPTLLLSAKDWEQIATKREINEKYVLLYAFSECSFKNELVKYYKNKKVTVYYIPFVKNQYNTFDGEEENNMLPLWNIGPAEFLSLIKNAEAIITDSFHGAVFSIIFNKQFIVFERDSSGKTSKNSRIYDLLNTFHLMNRLVRCTWSSEMETIIDYNSVNTIKEHKVIESITWLQRALSL